jgi:hypothetical protein
MKNSTIGNQTRDLPACSSAVPQLTTPLRAPITTEINQENKRLITGAADCGPGNQMFTANI